MAVGILAGCIFGILGAVVGGTIGKLVGIIIIGDLTNRKWVLQINQTMQSNQVNEIL